MFEKIINSIIYHKDIYYHYWKYGRKYKPNYSEEKTIPKIIHYCWFGRGKKNELIQKCMESWSKVLPEYKIMVWNEDTFPMDDYPFAQQALKDRKWAFVADIARLHALYHYGGIYMDTDMEVLKPLDNFLDNEFFSGYESDVHMSAGIMGAKKGNNYVKLLLDWYYKKYYKTFYYNIAITRIITKITKMALDVENDGCMFRLNGVTYYDKFIFYPRKKYNEYSKQYELNITNNTYTVHHFTGNWGD